MTVKFKTAFRGYLLVLTGLLLWTIWTSAQDKPGTNAPTRTAAVETPEAKSSPTAESQKPFRLTFGLDNISALRREIPAGIPIWQYLASLIYIFLAFAAAKFFDFLFRGYLKKYAERSKTRFDDLLLAIIDGPIKVVSFVILLTIGLEFFEWPAAIQEILRKGLTLVVAFSVTYMSLRLVDLLMRYWKQKAAGESERAFDEQLFPIIRKTLKVFLVVVAVLLTSDNLGLKITSVIASLSIGGLALGLAAQDTLANLFGAVSVFVDKPFRIGDRIKLDAIDGTVEAIGLRSTRIRNLDGHLITVPNKTMGSATITNVTRRPNIKTEMNIGVTYDTSTPKLKRALEMLNEIYRAHPMTGDLVVSFNKFGDSSLNILVVHWWNSTDHKAYLEGMQELNLQIKERFEAEGINFAFPTQTLYLKQDSEWRLQGEPIPEKPH